MKMRGKPAETQNNPACANLPSTESPGDSKEQRDAEEMLLCQLHNQLGFKLTKRCIPLPDGGRLEIDGVSDSPRAFCEAWAHQGSPKSAQKNKVMADALKMIYATKLTNEAARKILLFGDEQAALFFKGKSWMAQALRHFGIEVVVGQLPEQTKELIRRAQERQFR
jgi:hypothetical protein